jgi:hypothetical protein
MIGFAFSEWLVDETGRYPKLMGNSLDFSSVIAMD